MKLAKVSLILIGFALLFSNRMIAQHCGYCNASIKVFNIHKEGEKQTIQGLKIYLLDSLEQVIKISRFNFAKYDYQDDTFFIYQNPKLIKGDHEPAVKTHSEYFGFAKDHYVFVPNFSAYGATQMALKDVDGKANGGQFKKLIINIEESPYYPLCTSCSDWNWSPNGNDFVKGYKPIDIILLEE
jgi:hypothetical protein